nr:hypothetical protein [Enterobacter soli]
MRQVMLFGEGRNGEVFDIEEGRHEIRYIPDETFPLGGVVYTIYEHRSDNGKMYLVGYHGFKPSMPDVEDAIQRFQPLPI